MKSLKNKKKKNNKVLSSINKDREINKKYDRIGEVTYYIMLVFVIILISVSSVANALLRKAGLDINIVPKEIFDFLEKILWIFVLPVSIKIGGESFSKILLSFRSRKIE